MTAIPAAPEAIIPGPDTQRAFRDALGSYATGVTVITTEIDGGETVGITANSFAALSLEPALVLWSPARSSRRFAIFAEATEFRIHVLAADQMALARHFTTSSTPPAEGLGPVLARFDCKRHAVHEGGDHAIVVGQVLRFSHHAGAPLIFHGGRFGQLDLSGSPLDSGYAAR